MSKAQEQVNRLIDKLSTMDWSNCGRVRDMHGWFLNWYHHSKEAVKAFEDRNNGPEEEANPPTPDTPAAETRPATTEDSGESNQSAGGDPAGGA